MLEKHFKTICAKIHPNILKDMLPMEITPAAKWFLSESDKEHWEYSTDFPCIVPPSPLTWMEYEAPDVISSSERTVRNTVLRRCGCLCLTLEMQPEARQMAMSEDLLLRYMQALDGNAMAPPNWEGDRAYRQKHRDNALAANIQARWITIWNIVVELHTGELMTLGMYGLYLDESGRGIPGLNACITALSPELLAATSEAGDYDVFADALPFMFALSLSHCKNVTMSDVAVASAVAKKRAKKGLLSFTFKILDIKPMSAQAKRETEDGKSETKRALSIVRGHFKTFSADKPLFGRLTGSYWWNLSVRGNEENGTIQKEYKVHPQ